MNKEHANKIWNFSIAFFLSCLIVYNFANLFYLIMIVQSNLSENEFKKIAGKLKFSFSKSVPFFLIFKINSILSKLIGENVCQSVRVTDLLASSQTLNICRLKLASHKGNLISKSSFSFERKSCSANSSKIASFFSLKVLIKFFFIKKLGQNGKPKFLAKVVMKIFII